jgi:RimJ/RimL family protein N-acetyltransferase
MAIVTLRALTADDWRELRHIRLAALRSDPGMFFRSYADEVDQTEAQWIELASGDDAHQVFGVFDGARLVGISGVFAEAADPTGSTATFGMSYALAEYRHLGLIARLYQERLAWVRARPRFVRAVVGHRRSNEASRRAMERCGFRPLGVEPRRWHDGIDDDYLSYELLLRGENTAET